MVYFIDGIHFLQNKAIHKINKKLRRLTVEQTKKYRRGQKMKTTNLTMHAPNLAVPTVTFLELCPLLVTRDTGRKKKQWRTESTTELLILGGTRRPPSQGRVKKTFKLIEEHVFPHPPPPPTSWFGSSPISPLPLS
jgi:hypothetical protein